MGHDQQQRQQRQQQYVALYCTAVYTKRCNTSRLLVAS
jgi:hypothetical protein